MSAAPPLAGIAAAAGAEDIEPAVVDALVARWLFETGRLVPKGAFEPALEADAAPGASGVPDPDAAAFTLVALPGWCARATTAERLQQRLLPDWDIDIAGGANAVLTPPAGAPVTAPVTGSGPTLARAIVAATFSALLVLETLTPPLDALAALRGALREELADG